MSKKRLHEQLWQITKKLPTDFVPYGQRERNGGPSGKESTGDCSCGCAHFVPLEGRLSSDWGVCKNPQSPRVGLLTFEHQGCPQFTYDRSHRCERCHITRWEAVEIRGEKPWPRTSPRLCEQCRG